MGKLLESLVGIHKPLDGGRHHVVDHKNREDVKPAAHHVHHH